jgi:hypothetical protein
VESVAKVFPLIYGVDARQARSVGEHSQGRICVAVLEVEVRKAFWDQNGDRGRPLSGVTALGRAFYRKNQFLSTKLNPG